ncbi:MAG: hypothetical protein JXQ65_07055 [Candidatus Marinimicrobia bacterium]|nr:hypothetical protein [Candidatus Neomarinimicrobiota bacterium]
MEDQNYEALKEELEHFKKEKEKIRQIVGAIGGRVKTKVDIWVNRGLIAAMVILFGIAIMHHVLHIEGMFEATFYIELGMLFLSLKIIWMVHNQMKVNHFQFWILNSIEFRLNAIAKKIKEIDENIQK